MMEILRDDFTPASDFVYEDADDQSQADAEQILTESGAKTSGQGPAILGKIKGPFFVLDGKSRNGRFYEALVWLKQLVKKTILEKLKGKRMFGTIGHEQEINDQALLDGKISHVVVDLKENHNGIKGYGEAWILNTPAGQILNTVKRAGCELFSSSRAKGKYKGKKDGMPCVDPDNFFLEGFDFVMEPGFLEANPQIAESLNEVFGESTEDPSTDIEGDKTVSIQGNVSSVVVNNYHKGKNDAPIPTNENTQTSREDDDMPQAVDPKDTLIENLSNESAKLKLDLERALGTLEETKGVNAVLTDENNNLKENLQTLNEDGDVLKKYQELGEPGKINEALDRLETDLKAYREIGEVDEVRESIRKGEEILEKLKAFQELGPLEEVQKSITEGMALLSRWNDLESTPEQVRETLSKAKETIDGYLESGSVEEVKTCIDEADSMAESMEDDKAKVDCKELGEELGFDESTVFNTYTKMGKGETKTVEEGMQEVRTFLEDLKEKNANLVQYKKRDDNGDPKPEPIRESYKASGSRAARIMANLSGLRSGVKPVMNK